MVADGDKEDRGSVDDVRVTDAALDEQAADAENVTPASAAPNQEKGNARPGPQARLAIN